MTTAKRGMGGNSIYLYVIRIDTGMLVVIASILYLPTHPGSISWNRQFPNRSGYRHHSVADSDIPFKWRAGREIRKVKGSNIS